MLGNKMLGNNLLRGELTYLTALSDENLTTITGWSNDLDVSYLSFYHMRVFNEEQQRNWLQKSEERKNIGFGIYTREGDLFIGLCSLGSPDWRNRKSMLGITIGDKAYWNHGYGSDATRILLRYAFLELNLHRVYLGVFSYNTRAIHAYEKIGFVHEGTRRHVVFRDGEYHDMLMMALLRHEWEARYWPSQS